MGLPEIKTNREENLTKHVGFVYMHMQRKQKMEKLMMRNVATSRKSKTYIRHWKKRIMSVC